MIFVLSDGRIKNDRKKVYLDIVLGKPWCILAYSLGFSLIK
jgi:hypothetical protein